MKKRAKEIKSQTKNTEKHKLYFIILTCMAAIALFLAFYGLTGHEAKPDYAKMYAQAIDDASGENPAKIIHNLTPITSSNQQLIRDSNGRVLLVTWTSWDGYDSQTGNDVNLSREVWASVGYEAKDFCQALPEEAWVLRMEQELGLPPGNNKTRFVEMFVDAKDVFRPCADPEIWDTECGFSFPNNVSEEYADWFNSLRNQSYGENGYPWTRLGYTYDWGSPGHMGLSEYVIRPGAQVRIEGIYLNDIYCGK